VTRGGIRLKGPFSTDRGAWQYHCPASRVDTCLRPDTHQRQVQGRRRERGGLCFARRFLESKVENQSDQKVFATAHCFRKDGFLANGPLRRRSRNSKPGSTEHSQCMERPRCDRLRGQWSPRGGGEHTHVSINR
jgi:hypothetical protein